MNEENLKELSEKHLDEKFKYCLIVNETDRCSYYKTYALAEADLIQARLFGRTVRLNKRKKDRHGGVSWFAHE